MREAGTLNNLADALLGAGRYEDAAVYSEQPIHINQAEGFRSNQGHRLRTHGDILNRLGRTDPAADAYRRARAVVREINDRHAEANILESLDRASHRQRAGTTARRRSSTLQPTPQVRRSPSRTARQTRTRVGPAPESRAVHRYSRITSLIKVLR
jgi:tetratricopeptide (TPR) repeat protein